MADNVSHVGKEESVITDPTSGVQAPVSTSAPAGSEAGVYVRVVSSVAPSGSSAVTIADGADVAEGSTADAAVVGDVAGTVSAKLRGLSKILNSVWDSVNNWLKVSIQNTTLAVTQSGVWTVTANQGTASANDWRVDERRGLTISFAPIDVAVSGDNTIVAADVTRKIKVLSYVIVADAAVTARWKSGAGTNLSGAMSLAANGGVSAPPSSPSAGQWMETAVNQALVLNLGGAVGVRGHLSYFLEA